MPKISVIIPVYNKEEYIFKTIESVLAQNFTDFELIILDDGSTDKSLSIIKQFTDARIRLIEQDNIGVSATRNKGVLLAQTELIAFLDADDLWYSGHLEEIYFLHKNFSEAQFYATAYEIIYPSERIKKCVYHFDSDRTLIEKYYRFSIGTHLFYTSNFAVKKDIFEQSGGFKKMHSEDIDLFLSIGVKHKMAYSKQITMRYTINAGNSLSEKHSARQRQVLAQHFALEEKTDLELKKFLDFNRYTWVIDLKIGKELKEAQTLINEIDLKNLSGMQGFLLKLSPKSLKWLKKIQTFLTKMNININASSN